jgi:hypothetical protein
MQNRWGQHCCRSPRVAELDVDDTSIVDAGRRQTFRKPAHAMTPAPGDSKLNSGEEPASRNRPPDDAWSIDAMPNELGFGSHRVFASIQFQLAARGSRCPATNARPPETPRAAVREGQRGTQQAVKEPDSGVRELGGSTRSSWGPGDPTGSLPGPPALGALPFEVRNMQPLGDPQGPVRSWRAPTESLPGPRPSGCSLSQVPGVPQGPRAWGGTRGVRTQVLGFPQGPLGPRGPSGSSPRAWGTLRVLSQVLGVPQGPPRGSRRPTLRPQTGAA